MNSHSKSGANNGSYAQKGEPFVSVLTPVYNGEKFLRDCIESVLRQTYSNWEYLLVNNKSTDRTLQIMEEYAEKDDRIRIHNNKAFLPQMQNLNHAFRQISPESKYCKVVHADDMIFPDCITKMVALNEEYPNVGIVSSYRLDDNRVDLYGLPYPSDCIPGEKICRSYFLDGTYYFGAPTSLLIRSDLIREREKFYVETHQGTDTGVCIELLKKSDFGFVHQVLTFTRRHVESQSNTACLQNYTWFHAKLYNTLEYGPHFLNEKELKTCLNKDLHGFYSKLASNVFENRSVNEFQRQLQVLNELGIELSKTKFFKYLLRGLILHVFKKFNIELKQAAKRQDQFKVMNMSESSDEVKNPAFFVESNYPEAH